MKTKNFLLCAAALLAASCAVTACDERLEVDDAPQNVYDFSIAVGEAVEGSDIVLALDFRDAGLRVDNVAWGDPWKKATFNASVYDVYGRKIENAIFAGPDGSILRDGTRFDIGGEGKTNILLSSLRKGQYTLVMNIITRYDVDTWASATINVKDGNGNAGNDGNPVLVEDFTVPGGDNGMEIDGLGNVILDLRFYNAANPFRFPSTIIPANATNKNLLAESDDASVCAAATTGEPASTLVLTPATVGTCHVTVRSADGNARKTIGVKVIETLPDAEGFTLPGDDGETDGYDFDLANRLALDINVWNDGHPFTYICKPIPSNAADPSLVASSSDPAVVEAAIQNGNRLILTPKKPGYATVTVKTTDGAVVRTLRVAVQSRFNITLGVVEEAQSESDKVSGIFPCKITVKSSTTWMPPGVFHVKFYAKIVGRIDLDNPADWFKVEELKNSRTALCSFEDDATILYLPNGNSNYDLYLHLFSRLNGYGLPVHHSADAWSGAGDYTAYFKLHTLTLIPSVQENYDTNLYQATLIKAYDDNKNKIYSYLTR